MNSSTVLTLRFGWNTFDDITPLLYPFDAHTLGFNPAFADAIPVQRFPAVSLTGYQGTSFTGQGKTHYYSQGVNGTLTRLAGGHSFKVGGDYRVLGVKAEDLRQLRRQLHVQRPVHRIQCDIARARRRAMRSPICCSATRRPARCRSIPRSTTS